MVGSTATAALRAVVLLSLYSSDVVGAPGSNIVSAACESGWRRRNEFCYYFSEDNAYWTHARKTCQLKGGDLVSIHSSHEQQFLIDNGKGSKRYWLGYTDFAIEGVWRWTDGTQSDYTNWAPRQPDNSGSEDSAYMDPYFYGSTKFWNDVYCYNRYNYICKKRITPSSCSDKPCQHGGQCQSVGSGYQCKCVPGYTGNNCQEDNFCDEGWYHSGKFCYFFVHESLTRERRSWDAAQSECKWKGGNLVSIHSTEEEDFVFDHMGYSDGRFWIGLTDKQKEGTFKWIDGSKVDFTHWYPRVPDNNGNEDCAHIDPMYYGSAWSDVVCTHLYGYVCKKPAKKPQCESRPCSNGGTCEETESGDGYKCICLAGFTGKNCETNIDECASQPCINSGVCFDLVNDYRCECVDGFEGKDCQIDIDECASQPCMNSGTCSDLVNDYRCECLDGFAGKDCQIDIDECASQPCMNSGTCSDLVNDYRCECPDGFEGKDCEINIDECASQPCVNSGTCFDLVNDYRCECVDGFEGKDCQINIDECEPEPCLNGATCHDLINNYRCECAPGFTVSDCEIDINECDSIPCENWGRCTDLVNSYSCECTAGFEGTECQNAVQYCVHDSEVLHGDSCYELFTSDRSWSQAESDCRNRMGHLTSIHSDDEQTFLSDLASSHGRRIWIGLRDGKWSDDTPADYTNWADGQGSDDETGVCAALDPSLLDAPWVTTDCGEEHGSICKTTPRSGLDTNCGDGWTYMPSSNKCYSFALDDMKSWQDALRHCVDVGGELITISSSQEQSFVDVCASTSTGAPDNMVWIGLSDTFPEEGLRWCDGSEVTYSDWKSGKPRKEHCVGVHSGEGGTWSMEPCTQSGRYICQKEYPWSLRT